MFQYSFSGTTSGMETNIIHVEADVSDGLPLFSLVGLLGSEVKEARDRVRISIKNSGFLLTPKHITINLSPADIRKEGTRFDLAIAMSILAAYGFISENNLQKVLFLGELSLNGTIKPVDGVLPIALAAKENGFEKIVIPVENSKEGAVIEGIQVFGIHSLKETVMFINKQLFLRPMIVNIEELLKESKKSDSLDFSDVHGQESMKRALEVAAAGMHNILMIGPPGGGKTMLARRIPTILPELTLKESMEISKIYSIKGLLNNNQSFIIQRPFRSPHHTITDTALVGGGRTPKPGELSLAYGGVLFLDELTEFKMATLELLRQPLEERMITISRLNGTFCYPAGFMLVAAMNPCRCGYYPDRNRCNCTPFEIKRYLGKVSQPLLDRIDICTEAVAVKYKDLEEEKRGESSKEIRARVSIAREIQMERYQGENFLYNTQLTPKTIKQYCFLETIEKHFIENVFIKLQLNPRSYHRILKVARTIGDLEESKKIKKKHLSEAICYRTLDKKYWI